MLRYRHCLPLVCSWLCTSLIGFAAQPAMQLDPGQNFAGHTEIPTARSQRFLLSAGDTVGINVRIARPSHLPENARVRASWILAEPSDPATVPHAAEGGEPLARKVDAYDIYTAPTADWSKILHALDGDVFLNYRAPVAGIYELRIAPMAEKVDLFEGPRWREPGKASQIARVPGVALAHDVAAANMFVATTENNKTRKQRLYIVRSRRVQPIL